MVESSMRSMRSSMRSDTVGLLLQWHNVNKRRVGLFFGGEQLYEAAVGSRCD